MDALKLYRKRYIPNETVYLKDDVVLDREDAVIVTKWNVLHPKAAFSHGISCYYLDRGWKVSKFMDKNDRLVYYYCDIIDTEYREAENAYIFTDLLADVIVYENGFVKVVDLAEIADAREGGIIGEREVSLALRRLDALLELIYDGRFAELLGRLEVEAEDGK